MREDLAERVLASMRCGVISIDATGTVTSLNEPAQSCLGADPREVVGADCREAFRDCPQIAHLLLGALDRGTLPDRAELELRSGKDERLLVGFSLSRIEGDGGEVLGSAIFFKDLRLVEEERERQALRNRLAGLGEVSAHVAHELRNLLGGVRLFLGLARRRLQEDEAGRTYLDRADAELLQANGKLTQMLDFVRPLALELAPAAAETVVREALETTLARLSEAGTEIVWECAPDLPPILADAGRLRDALANLFANAVEAMEGGGELRVRVLAEETPVLVASSLGASIPEIRGFGESRAARVRVEITDQGPGMSPDVLRRIFQPFFTTKQNGSGLGVPGAQKIVDAHGGILDVRSEVGRGTTFILLLPIAPEEAGCG
ncbi:MAG: PAS domain-containing protein [Deltaproteobacteria bacterium]|nr:PAS domain-containing protein [Deltaproteobacteria bacterium]